MKLYITNATNSYKFIGILDLIEKFDFSLIKLNISKIEKQTDKIIVFYKNGNDLEISISLYEEVYVNDVLTSFSDTADYLIANIPVISGGGGEGTNDHTALINRDAAGNHAIFTPLSNSTSSYKVTNAEGTVFINVDSTNDIVATKVDRETIRGKYDYHRQVAATDTDGDWRTYSDANGFYIDYFDINAWVNRLTVQSTI